MPLATRDGSVFADVGTWAILALTWVAVLGSWFMRRAAERSKEEAQIIVGSHKVYDLAPLGEHTVSIMCATPGCGEPLGIATVMGWGHLAERHYKDKQEATNGG